MAKVSDVCKHVRSKNAGPYWVTFDLFFKDEAHFAQYHDSPTLSPELFAGLYGAAPDTVKQFSVPSLNMVKVSYGRKTPQGGEVERDMHCGQQFVRLLDVELEPTMPSGRSEQ
ncbi:MAG: DUF4387 domain-containing protein [Flavobacteriaceae bacterium]|nr:DUF4387 domain-containing protein [Flavobacteriaceae bacterium]